MDPGNEPGGGSAWLETSRDLSEPDKRQLTECYFKVINPDWTSEQVLAGDHAFFAAYDHGLTECPIEGWDIVGAGGEVAYQLWIQADSGVIVRAGTTEVIARINRCELELFEDEHLRGALSAARDEAKRHHPSAEIAGFPDRYWLEE